MTSDSQNAQDTTVGVDVILQDGSRHRTRTISELRKITGLSVQSTVACVDFPPSLVKSGVSMEEAETIKSRLEKHGVVVELVPHSVSSYKDADTVVAGNQTDPKTEALSIALNRLDPVSKSVLVRREVKELPSILWEGELPEMLASGTYNNGNGVLVCTDRRAVFVDKGMLGSLKIEDFPYDRISSIESKRGMLLGEITIYVSGNKERITNVSKDQVSAVADFLRNKVHLSGTKKQTTESVSVALQPATPISASAPLASVADELEKFANLHARGIISDEEFNAQKARLLQG